MRLNSGRPIGYIGVLIQYKHFKKYVFELKKKSKLTDEELDVVHEALKDLRVILSKDETDKYEEALSRISMILSSK